VDDSAEPEYSGTQSYTFGNGMIIKRGIVSGSQNTSIAIAFTGDDFTNTEYTVSLTPIQSGTTNHSFNVNIRSKAVDGMVASQPNGGAAYDNMDWIAIGF
jgi:hypothetical protein